MLKTHDFVFTFFILVLFGLTHHPLTAQDAKQDPQETGIESIVEECSVFCLMFGE